SASFQPSAPPSPRRATASPIETASPPRMTIAKVPKRRPIRQGSPASGNMPARRFELRALPGGERRAATASATPAANIAAIEAIATPQAPPPPQPATTAVASRAHPAAFKPTERLDNAQAYRRTATPLAPSATERSRRGEAASISPALSEPVAHGAEHVALGPQEAVAARQARRVVLFTKKVRGIERKAPVLPAEFGIGIDQRVIGCDDPVGEGPAVRSVLARIAHAAAERQ